MWFSILTYLELQEKLPYPSRSDTFLSIVYRWIFCLHFFFLPVIGPTSWSSVSGLCPLTSIAIQVPLYIIYYLFYLTFGGGPLQTSFSVFVAMLGTTIWVDKTIVHSFIRLQSRKLFIKAIVLILGFVKVVSITQRRPMFHFGKFIKNVLNVNGTLNEKSQKVVMKILCF